MKQHLHSLFSEEQDQFNKLGHMWALIRHSKKNAIQDNLRIKDRGWREQFRLEEIKEEYLQAVIMEKTCNELSSLCSMLYMETLKSEETELWQQLKKKLSSEEIEKLQFLTEYKYKQRIDSS